MNSAYRTLTVDLGDRSYPIYIGAQLRGSQELYRQHVSSRQVMIVTNATIAPLYMQQVVDALADYEIATVVLPDGEKYKTLDVLTRVYDELLRQRFDRNCTLIALGGGVVGDMTGFAAASYQRGVNFIQVPTTLLAQVDSSVGGKTGVNHPLGKNMIGAFHQPRCVIADIETLNTLPDRELSAGLAEVIKYGLINDLEFFAWLEEHIDELRVREPSSLAFAIERSCADKAKVVAADELEAGQRALLNLGHTFGHAIENGMGYGNWLHGEAVGAGMCMAADLSRRMGWIDEAECKRVVALIARAKLSVAAPKELAADEFEKLMAVDKKVQDGRLRLVLLKGIGKALVTADFDSVALRATLHG